MDSEFIKRQKDDFFRDFSALGGVWIYLLAVVVFLIRKEYQLVKRLFVGLILLYIIVILIRSFYFKHRPNKLGYSSFIGKIDASSFPSQHSSRITFMSAVLAVYYNTTTFCIALAFIAILVIYSRVYLKKHDVIDVIAGIGIGLAVYFLTGLMI